MEGMAVAPGFARAMAGTGSVFAAFPSRTSWPS